MSKGVEWILRRIMGASLLNHELVKVAMLGGINFHWDFMREFDNNINQRKESISLHDKYPRICIMLHEYRVSHVL